MALPEYAFSDDFILTPEDLTPDALDVFHRHCNSSTGGTLMSALNGPAQEQHIARVTRYSPLDPLDDDAALMDWALK
jgi:hypothetical protein